MVAKCRRIPLENSTFVRYSSYFRSAKSSLWAYPLIYHDSPSLTKSEDKFSSSVNDCILQAKSLKSPRVSEAKPPPFSNPALFITFALLPQPRFKISLPYKEITNFSTIQKFDNGRDILPILRSPTYPPIQYSRPSIIITPRSNLRLLNL